MKWIKVEDRLPEPGERVLVAVDGFVCEAFLKVTGQWERYRYINFESYMGKVEAWMPMPKY